MRDPRVAPRPGDVIMQRPGLVIAVHEVRGDLVSWESKLGTIQWTLTAWRERVAKDAAVLCVYGGGNGRS